MWWKDFHFTKLPATKKKARCLLESLQLADGCSDNKGECTHSLIWDVRHTGLLAAHQGIFGPARSWAPYTPLNLPWNNSLMWHAAWHKTHSHLWQWMPPLYYKDTSSERISSFHREKKKKKRRGRQSRGQRLVARNWKRNEQVSPFQLLSGMTTLPQRQPCICLSAVKLFNPQSVTQRETAFTAIHRHKGPCSGLR